MSRRKRAALAKRRKNLTAGMTAKQLAALCKRNIKKNPERGRE